MNQENYEKLRITEYFSDLSLREPFLHTVEEQDAMREKSHRFDDLEIN